MEPTKNTQTVSHESLRPFIVDIFSASGSLNSEAEIISDHLIDASLKGHDSHGVMRTVKYIEFPMNPNNKNSRNKNGKLNKS
jgi:uncharacterized oxidoreductase